MKLTLTTLLTCTFFYFSIAQSFEDFSESLQFNQTGHNVGLAIGDFDGNGLEDIYVSRKGDKNLLYVNRGDFHFEEVGQQYGLDFIGNTNCSLWFDMDNDGDQDLFLGNQFGPNRLFRNDGGAFKDVSFAYGIGRTVGNVHSVNAADFDNDGDLDLYVAQSMQNNILWRNEGGTHFVNYTQAAGIYDVGPSMGAVFFDYDNDGDVDLYQTRDNDAGNLFYRNDGGYFTDISEHSKTNYHGQGMGVDIGDINGDGLLDFYLTNLYENVLFVQNIDHTFDQHFIEGLADNGMGWGTAIFDSNNNGWKDIYLANESNFGVADIHQSNKLFVNQGNLNFFLPPPNEYLQNRYSSYAVAHADFDKDGKMDFACANAGADGNQIFKNTSSQKNYLNVQLEGTQSNSKGIGARIYTYANGKYWMDVSTCGTGYAAQNTSNFHFGLKDEPLIDSLVIYWPSGKVQRLHNIQANQTITVNESSGLLELGPVVWTEPPFPTQLDDITLYFDAKEGNGALAGFTGTVYAHAGVITNKSSTPTDWQYVQGNWGTADPKVRMTSEGDDVYSMSYNIEDFYGIPAGEVVEQLAFVFRNADGSTVGRATDGSDIFLEVFPPTADLLVNLVSPQNNTIIYQEADLIIDVQSNQMALIDITDNGNSIFSDSTRQANFTINPTELGAHTLNFVVSNGTNTEVIERTYFVIERNATGVDAPTGTRDGINYHTDSTFIFSLTAPNKAHAFLLCPANDFQVNTDFQLNQASDKATFWIELPKSLFDNNQNTYQYLVDGQIKIADPCAELVLDPSHDDFIPEDVKATLPPYPTGLTTGIVTAFDLVENVYDWQVSSFEKPKKTDLVIYEIMMRDFLEDKNYKSLLDTLDYLDRLGINAIELMPIQEFEGNQSWGYNPSFHMAVDKYYGSRDQLRAVIDAAHQRGIAVILDVVFNHAFSQSPLCQMYWNSADFQPASDNPWLNETARHPFNVGYDFNHESDYTKAWVKRILEHWITEYKFDGFRFDLSKGITQTFSGSNAGAFAQYDISRVNILKEYADHIWSLDATSYVILEHFADNSEEKDLSDYGMMLWGNLSHEFTEAAMGYSSDLDWADYKARGWNSPHLIAYMESHDEERMGFKLKNFGDANANYDTRDLETSVDRVAAASAIYLSLPGPKMLWQFGELSYDYSINRCVNSTINPNCRLDPKPIRWDYFENEDRQRLYDRIAAINHLRTTYPTFETLDYTFHDGNFFLKTINLNHADMDAVVMANFRIVNSDLNPKFPYQGTWYEYFTGAEIDVTHVEDKLTFSPGEYRIYTSEKIVPPNGFFNAETTTSVTNFTDNNISIYPSILATKEQFQITLGANQAVEVIEIINMQGAAQMATFQQSDKLINVQLPAVAAGMYIVSMRTDAKVFTTKIVVQ